MANNNKYEILFSPISIGNMQLRNRIVMTAAEMSIGGMYGKPTEQLMDYYEERARGGAGLIIPGTTRVNDWDSASMFTQLAMSHDYHIEPAILWRCFDFSPFTTLFDRGPMINAKRFAKVIGLFV